MKRLVLVVILISCNTRAGQVTLKTGQCVLDTGVEAILLADLAQANYAQLVSDAVTKLGPTVVTCALQAIAATAPASTGSGSAATGEAPVVVLRAREMLAKHGASK